MSALRDDKCHAAIGGNRLRYLSASRLLAAKGVPRLLAALVAPNDKDANPVEPICVLTFVILVSTCPSRCVARDDRWTMIIAKLTTNNLATGHRSLSNR